jgi:predicted NAD/FAD-binding protein
MSEPSGSSSSVTRREVLKGAAGLAALGAGAVRVGRDVDTAAASSDVRARRGPGRGRVAIVGAGAGGVAAAYFLADGFDVDLFEARAKVGGHCDSHAIGGKRHRVTVDLGAQFFHPDTHPIYVTLLEELGLYDPARPGADKTLQAAGSLCIFPTGGAAPIFSSSHPLSTLQRSLDFAKYTQLARDAVLSNMPWETTVRAWIRGLPVSESFKEDIAYPWTAALIGCSRDDAERASARSILQTFALSFPAHIAEGATTYNSLIGLQGNLQRMLDRSPAARVHLSTPARALVRTRTGWFVDTRSGRWGPYRCLVLNAPPRDSKHLLRPRQSFGHVTAILDEYRYFDSRLAIHTDPAFMPHARGDWASYNAEVEGRQCAGSVWYGALRPRSASGQTIDVFKSWIERRHARPARVLLERRFKHPLITASTIHAARELGPLQGHHGLYFSGQYTCGFDSQESAVYAAMKVAESVAPASQRLASLKALLAASGRANISYAL